MTASWAARERLVVERTRRCEVTDLPRNEPASRKREHQAFALVEPAAHGDALVQELGGPAILLQIRGDHPRSDERPDTGWRVPPAVRRQGLIEPSGAFAEMTADEPEAPEAVAEPHRRLGLPAVKAPAQRRTQVGVIERDALGPELLRRAGPALSLLRESDVVPSVSGADGLRICACVQLREGELPDGREHLESRPGFWRLGSLDEAVVDKRDEPVQHVDRGRVGSAEDRFGLLERTAAGKHPQPTQHAALVRAEQPVAPSDGRPQLLLALG